MARNKLAGKSKGKSKSAKYFANNKAARDKKNAYNKKYHGSPERIKYRQELNKKNREDGTYGNGDGKDKSHTKSGRLVSESQSSNRARNGKNKKSKRKKD
tara:strand:+ start:29 stop:328 length:300 start_codon:yes stop_codon:yes gene_type:complete